MTDGVQAVALFFDELRFEVHNKFSLMGQYVGAMYLLDPMRAPVDRLGIIVYAKWPLELRPHTLCLRIELPRQEPLDFDLTAQQQFPESSEPPSPFRSRLFQTGMNLRFPPLQVGDALDVWLTVNDQVIPAGRLSIRSQPPEVQGTPSSITQEVGERVAMEHDSSE